MNFNLIYANAVFRGAAVLCKLIHVAVVKIEWIDVTLIPEEVERDHASPVVLYQVVLSAEVPCLRMDVLVEELTYHIVLPLDLVWDLLILCQDDLLRFLCSKIYLERLL